MFNMVEHYILREKGRSNIFIDDAAYRYIMAGNGILVQANNEHLYARVPVSEAKVRGLEPLPAKLSMMHGLIPQRLFDLALSVMLASPDRERYVGIIWDNGYQLYVPEQDSSAAGVKYPTAENVVVELHSHPGMAARFSEIDDKDEQGFKVYGVVGQELVEVTTHDSPHRQFTLGVPSLSLRVGVYGYFMSVPYMNVFDGVLQGVSDMFFAKDAGR